MDRVPAAKGGERRRGERLRARSRRLVRRRRRGGFRRTPPGEPRTRTPTPTPPSSARSPRGKASRAAVTIAASRRYGSSSGFPSGARVRATPSSPSRSRRDATPREDRVRFARFRPEKPPRRRRLDESVAILAEGRNSPVAIASGVVVNWRSGGATRRRRRRRAIGRRRLGGRGGRSGWRVFCVSRVRIARGVRRLRRRGGDPARDEVDGMVSDENVSSDSSDANPAQPRTSR